MDDVKKTISLKERTKKLLADATKKFGLDQSAMDTKIQEEQAKPLTAAIFGQTGVGKSSLTNALFGTRFAVDDVRPCTKEAQCYRGKDSYGNTVIFWDVPGIGESDDADNSYLKIYAEIALKCDVILWAFQADTRSISVDAAALRKLVEILGKETGQKFLARICVVVTKADSVVMDSWIFAKSNNVVLCATGPQTETLLDEKSKYFYYGLFGGYANTLQHRIAITKKNIDGKIPKIFEHDEGGRFIYFKGEIDNNKAREIIRSFPNWEDEINQIKGGQKAIICSARLNFNLNEVKVMIARKAGGATSLRLSQSLTGSENTISWEKVKKLGLPILFDKKNGEVIFDIDQL